MTLREKRCVFTEHVAELIREARSLGFECALDQVKRTQAEADANAAAGTGIKRSLHLVGLAVDLLLYRDGVYLTATQDYEPLGNWWEAQSTTSYTLAWGGRFRDGNHFSLAHEGRR